jgi:tripartite-type tricarboxylate transporter receptor subunit TctC
VIARRGLLAGTGATALTLASFALALLAPPFPPARADRRLTLLIGASRETAADRVARSFAPFLARQLPATGIALRNLPGEAGLTGFRALADAAPNGDIVGWVATPVLPARLVDRDAGALLPRLRLLGAVQREPIVFVSPTATPLAAAPARTPTRYRWARRPPAARRTSPRCGCKCSPGRG